MKAIVLSSGGIDSTTCVALAVKKHGKENVATVSVYYGQRLAKEIQSARKITEYYGLKHYELDLSQVFKFSDCTLIKESKKNVVEKSYQEQLDELQGESISSYVPFRNGLMISAVAALALSIYKNEEIIIYIGAHASDFAYADCSKEFLQAINKAVNEGSYHKITIVAPLSNMTKTDVVKLGISLKTPYQYTWSCYKGEERPCMKCGSCIDRAKAFADNGVKDPALED